LSRKEHAVPDNINQVALTGNLTHDPNLVELPSGHVFSELQLACHKRSRDELTGVWREWPDYFTVKTFGFQARTTYEHLRKGQGIALSGRLSARRTPGDNDDGQPRHEVEIIAEVVQFLSRPHRR
jgi:single stranded DNA-binding protein